MLILRSTDLLRVITSSTADVHVHASWVDLVDAATSASPNRTDTAVIVTATTTTVVAGPAASTSRTVNFLSCRNSHATTANDVTVFHNDGTTTINLIKVTLAAGEALVNDRGTWFVYDVNGAVKASTTVAASDTQAGVIEIAVQSEMETGTDVVRAVVPGRQHFHPGHPKAWLVCGVTANILASYNITSLTDTGTGDVAVTIATDFSSVNYSVTVTVQQADTVGTAASAREGTIKSATLAAGTFSMQCWDNTATTRLVKDPTTWHAQLCGDQA